VTDPVKQSIDYSQKYFALLEEFFTRATGKTALEFSSIETFNEVVRASARDIGPRGEDAFTWLDAEFRPFLASEGLGAFSNAKQLGGVNLVLGGSSRFGRSQLNATSATVLYSDTVLIPDPVAPWMETEREEEKFRHVLLLQAAHALLHLKPLVDAGLSSPPVVVFPSWEKLLEDNDPQTQVGIAQLFADVMSNFLGESLSSLEEVLEYSDRNPDQTMQTVDRNQLLVAPGGPIGEPLVEALERYETEVAVWRSEDWVEGYRRLPPHRRAISGVLERLGPIYHLLENAEELSASPLMSVEQQAHYFRLISKTSNTRLSELGVLDPGTGAILDALGSQRLRWIGGVAVETLVELRENNENLRFREIMNSCIQRLSEGELNDIDRVAAEVCRDLDIAISEHERELREIQEKYDRVHGQTAVVALAAAGAALMPALAPLLGTVAPLAVAAKYGHDKIAELSEKRDAARSVLGVLALSRPSD